MENNQKNIGNNNDEKAKAIFTKMELITPERASQLLAVNTMNRPLRQSWVETIVSDILKNNYTPSARPIEISTENVLLDGQHRLHAIIKTGRSLWLNVSYNVPPESYVNIDKSKARTAGDVFAINGVTCAGTKVSGINMWYTLHAKAVNARFPDKKDASNKDQRGLPRDIALNNIELYDIYLEHKNLIDNLFREAARYHKKYNFYSRIQLIGIMMYLILDKNYNYEYVVDFFNQLYFKQDIKNGTITSLRDKLIDILLGKEEATFRRKLNYLIFCWNAFVKNKTYKTLKMAKPKNDGNNIFIDFI